MFTNLCAASSQVEHARVQQMKCGGGGIKVKFHNEDAKVVPETPSFHSKGVLVMSYTANLAEWRMEVVMQAEAASINWELVPQQRLLA